METSTAVCQLRHEPQNFDIIMARELDYWNPQAYFRYFSAQPSTVDTLGFQCQEVTNKGCSRQSKSAEMVIQGLRA